MDPQVVNFVFLTAGVLIGVAIGVIGCSLKRASDQLAGFDPNEITEVEWTKGGNQ